MTKSAGFIDFSDDPDAWRSNPSYEKDGKLFIAQGAKCHESHPALALGKGQLLGGNCRDHARHTGVDLYVALDGSMEHPLYEIGKVPPRCAYYPIKNMGIPTRPDKFLALIDMIVSALQLGLTVHVGCIGGHGRTGMVLAAVVARMGIDKDAIGYVRANYCKKAVETKAQEGFLVTHLGCTMPPAGPTPYEKSTGKVDKRGRGR